MNHHIADTIKSWKKLRKTRAFHNALVFLGFMVVATIFWFLMALNGNMQGTLKVAVRISNVPDSVTFINDPPTNIHIDIRDKGTSLLRSAIFKDPTLVINFQEFASNGVLRFKKNDLLAALRTTFGNGAHIAATSIDSLYLEYTLRKGRRIPIVAATDVTTASGYVTEGSPRPDPGYVMVYSNRSNLDTLTRVFTEKVVKRDLTESTEATVNIVPIAGMKIIPSKVKVKIPVEPLVNQQTVVQIEAVNVPANESVILFPSTVGVDYFTPMSTFDKDAKVSVVADYRLINRMTGRIPIRIAGAPSFYHNVRLQTDSVEYTVVIE